MSFELVCIRCEKGFESENKYKNFCSERCEKTMKFYDLEFLKKFCRIKKVKLIGEYDNVYSKTMIRGKCKLCDNEFGKIFRYIIRIGPFCRKCTVSISKENRRQTCLKRYRV